MSCLSPPQCTMLKSVCKLLRSNDARVLSLKEQHCTLVEVVASKLRDFGKRECLGVKKTNNYFSSQISQEKP